MTSALRWGWVVSTIPRPVWNRYRWRAVEYTVVNFEFRKAQEISLLAEDLLGSEGELRFVELVDGFSTFNDDVSSWFFVRRFG